MKKIFAAAAAAAALMLSGCTVTSSRYNAMQDYDFSVMQLVQLEPPREGQTIAIVDTDLGEFRMVLYEDLAPDTAAAFIERARAGEYDGLPVYVVYEQCYFMTGGHENKRGAYVGRENDNELIPNECNVNLWPFKGALMAYSEHAGYSDARWFVCSAEEISEDSINELKDSVADNENSHNLQNLFDKFYEVGGIFGLSGTVTVFGQTYEGLDVVEALCEIPVNEQYRPYEDVMIKSITISEYGAEGE